MTEQHRIDISQRQRIAASIKRSQWLDRLERLSATCEMVALTCLITAALLALLLAAVAINVKGEWPHLRLVAVLLLSTLGLGFTALLLARLKGVGLGWAVLLLGLFCLNFPVIVAALAAQLHASSSHAVLQQLFRTLPPLGAYLMLISVVHIIIANVYFIVHGRVTAAQQFEPAGKRGTSADVSYIPKCWEMYACPQAVRGRCPNYKDHIVCWQRRAGCLCDSKFAAYLFRSQPDAADGPLDVTPVPDIDTFPVRLRNTPPISWSKKQHLCHECAIYLEHQGIKYRRLNWIFLPITGLIVLAGYQYYDMAYNALLRYLDQISRTLEASGHLPIGMTMDTTTLINSPYEYVLLAVLSMLVMSIVVEFTDRILLEWMW